MDSQTDLTVPLPVAAHNCYLSDSDSNQLLVDALYLGMDNIEIDLGWDHARKRLIVGHDAEAVPGKAYPEFRQYFEDAYARHLLSPRQDGAPHVLTIDWKTDSIDAITSFAAFLNSHSDWFSSAPKTEQGSMTQRGLTVCLTGSKRAKRRYDELIPQGATYMAFADEDYGPEVYFKDANEYARKPASAYRRFISMFWGQVGRVPPGADFVWDQSKEQRLRTIVSRAHAQGYQIRVYTLNGSHGDLLERFPSASDARQR